MASSHTVRLRRIYLEVERNEDIPKDLFKRLLYDTAAELSLNGEVNEFRDEKEGLIVELEGDILPTSRYVRYVRILQSVVGRIILEEVLDIEESKFQHEGMTYFPIVEGEGGMDEARMESTQEEIGVNAIDDNEPFQESQPLLPESRLFDTEELEEMRGVEEESQSILAPRRRT